MKSRAFLAAMAFILTLPLALPQVAAAEVVGRFTQVEGRVDLLKGGKLPATPVKLQDGVEPGDVLRTKSLSKAQITFIDNSTITISPESRLAIEEYLLDPAQKKRNAVLNIFQGLVHVVVSKLFKVEEPDFVVKTHTAVMGVRGTDFGVRLQPNSTTVLNFQGALQVGNVFPEVGQLFRRAAKIAFAWGGSGGQWVTLRSMQGTNVGQNLPPTLPFTVTPQSQQQFMNQLGSGLMGRGSGQGSGSGTATGGGTGSGGSGTRSASSGSGSGSSSGSGGTGTGTTGAGTTTASAGGGTSGTVEYITNLGGPDSGLGPTVSGSGTGTGTGSTSVPATTSLGLITGTGSTAVTTLNTVTIQPVNTPTETPSPSSTETPSSPEAQTYSFTQTTQDKWTSTANSSGTSNTVTFTGWGVRTGVSTSGALALPDSYAGHFTASGTGDRTVLQGATLSSSTGTSTGALTGTVTGVSGSTLTGTGTYSGTNSFGETTSYSGTVVIDPSGQLTFTYTNGTISSSRRLLSASGTSTDVPGTPFTQTMDGAVLRTSAAPYSSASLTTTGRGLWAGGSRTGVLPGSYNFALTGTETSSWGYSYLANELGSLTATIQGVVSPGSGDTYQGAMTITPSDRQAPFTSSLLPQFQPSFYLFPGNGGDSSGPIVSSITIQADGSASGTAYSTYFQNWKFASSVLILSQTVPQTSAASPVSATYNFTESYNGAFGLNGAAPGATGGNGWGLRSFNGTGSTAGTSGYNGYFGSYDKGTWTATSGTLSSSYYGSALGPGSGTTAGTALVSGSVSGTLGQNLSGNMTFIGSLLNGASFSYSGTVTIDSSGNLKFTYGNSGGSSTWLYPGGASGTASGTMYQYPGYHFTQTMTGDNYQVIVTDPNNATLTLSNSSSTGGSRSLVSGGSIGTFSGAFSLYSPNSGAFLPMSGTNVSLIMEGVVGTSDLGVNSGVASLNINMSPWWNLTVPGTVSLTPGATGTGIAGGSVFSPAQVYIQNSMPYAIQVSSGLLAQTPIYAFSETIQGFGLRTITGTSLLANMEGYGYGQRTGSSDLSGGSNNYLGYFLSQDLGTRASTTAMTSKWLGLSGTLSGTLSGVLGQTLAGQATYSGTTPRGGSFNYQGSVFLSSDGQLLFNYGGTWTTASGRTGTGSGTIAQIPGTYFTETLTGNYSQSSSSYTVSGGSTLNVSTFKDSASLTGTRTMDPSRANTTTSTTASVAGSQSSTTTSFPSSSSGPVSVNLQGVVAGAAWQGKWGVATVTANASSGVTGSVTGPVAIGTNGNLTGQFVNNSSGLAVNLLSVPTSSGQTTTSYIQTASGAFSQVANTDGSVKTVTTPTPLTGTSRGVLPGAINANLALTSTALQPGSYTTGSGTVAATTVGVVAGPSGGTQNGVATVQAVKTVGAQTTTPTYVGAATLTPAAGSTPATLTTILSGVNSVPGPPVGTGAGATQTGTLTVTPR